MTEYQTDLVKRIAEEIEYKLPEPSFEEIPSKFPDASKIYASQEIINEAMIKGRRACIAFSGGSDSLVLLKLVAGQMGHPLFKQKPIVIWADSQMEYPETKEYIIRTVAGFNLELKIAKAKIPPIEQWERHGFPLLGKQASREWCRRNKSAGFRINCSECCRTMKIQPARRLARNLGVDVQLTGQKGSADHLLAGYRAKMDGIIKYQKRDRMWIANPLTGWTRPEIRGFIEKHNLPEHPARTKRKAKTIGCVFCGGGSQYEDSCYPILRRTWPEAWERFMVSYQAGIIILAVKYKTGLLEVSQAVSEFGGLRELAKTRPWVFDYTRPIPMRQKGR